MLHQKKRTRVSESRALGLCVMCYPFIHSHEETPPEKGSSIKTTAKGVWGVLTLEKMIW